jgi:transposase InsO family protein
MKNDKYYDIATFRYNLIAPVVNRKIKMPPGEIARYFSEVSKQEHVIPGSNRKTVSIRTLERWKEAYEKRGYEGLFPKTGREKGICAVSQEVLDHAIALRKEVPSRSVEQIIYIMEVNRIVEEGKLADSTLSRHFRMLNLPRIAVPDAGNSNIGRKRFEASEPMELWQSDFKHAAYLPDTDNPGKFKRTKLLVCLDDQSRYITHGEFYFDEALGSLEDCLRKALLKHSAPSQYYCDNGPVFNSKHLANICARLGIRLSHTKPYEPEGRGKCEKFFKFIDSSFLGEINLLISKGMIITLSDLNRHFNLWLDGYYHCRIHKGTKEKPKDRFSKHVPARVFTPEELRRIFLMSESRKVDKTGCVSFQGIIYDCDPGLAGKTIEVRYTPDDTSEIEVWLNDKYVCKAKEVAPKGNFNNYSSRHSTYVKAERISKRQTPTTAESNYELGSFMDAAKMTAYSHLLEDVPLKYAEEKKNGGKSS